MHTKYQRNKHPFTLIEMLIVIALIGIAFGALSLPVAKALRGEKFERGVDQVIAKLVLAQEVMLDFHTDVRLTLHHTGEEMICSLETDVQLPAHLEKSLNRYSKIVGIEQMVFDNSVRESVVICFNAAHSAISRGTLTLIFHGREEHIVLKGYPSQIKRGKNEKSQPQVPYPEEILFVI